MSHPDCCYEILNTKCPDMKTLKNIHVSSNQPIDTTHLTAVDFQHDSIISITLKSWIKRVIVPSIKPTLDNSLLVLLLIKSNDKECLNVHFKTYIISRHTSKLTSDHGEGWPPSKLVAKEWFLTCPYWYLLSWFCMVFKKGATLHMVVWLQKIDWFLLFCSMIYA